MFMFVVYCVLFVGGLVLMGIAHELPAWNGVAFTAGILAVSLAMGLIIHSRGNAKHGSSRSVES